MKIGASVRKAIDDWEQNEHDAAVIHACNAVDGTAKKALSHEIDYVGQRFKTFLRNSYSVLGPMGLPGVDLKATRFPVAVRKPSAPGGGCDIADIIYGIHRCNHLHGDELPAGFELVHDAAGPSEFTRLRIRDGSVMLSDRIIFAMLAVVVLSPVNVGERVPDSYFLTFGTQFFPINEWWGRYGEFERIVASANLPSVTLDFGSWTVPPA